MRTVTQVIWLQQVKAKQNNMTADILIIDDEEDIRSLIRGILEDEGYHIREAGNDQKAYASIEAKKPDLIILDIWLHNSEDDGMEILARAKKLYPFLPVLMISGHGTIETAVSAIKHGAYDFIEKPFKSDRLILMIERALETAKLRAENESLKRKSQDNSEFLGQSAPIVALRHTAEKVAHTNSRILITGEPGTGKDVMARYIHSISNRSTKPFLTVNCAILNPEGLEAELFGEDRSQSGGAVHKGVFEEANGGTLLLDQVSDMPLETQGKILRVLQEQKFQRVGGTESIEVDVRIIAATNQDLQQAMKDGSFREDLYYRLNVVPLHMPRLKTIAQDIPELVEHFTASYSEQAGLMPCEYSQKAIAVMQSYDWPGNIRQLKNVVEWLMIMATSQDGKTLCVENLPPEIKGKSHSDDSDNSNKGSLISVPLREARELFEKDYLLSQIKRFGGNISKTAEFVGMERSALHRKLKQLGIKAISKTGGNDQDHEVPDQQSDRKRA